MVIFHSYVSLPEGNHLEKWWSSSMGFGWHPFSMKWKIKFMFQTTNQQSCLSKPILAYHFVSLCVIAFFWGSSYWRSSHWWVKWGCCYPSMLPEWFSIKRSWCSQFWGCPVAIKPRQCQKKSIWSHCHVIVIVNDEIVFGTDQSPISSNGFVSKIRYVIPSHGWQNYIP